MHSQTKNNAKSGSMKLPAPMPEKNAIDETKKQASVRMSICDFLRCFSPKTSRSVTRTHQLNAFHIVYIAHCSRKLFHAVENGTSVCLSATEASKVKISKQSLAQLRRKLTESRSPDLPAVRCSRSLQRVERRQLRRSGHSTWRVKSGSAGTSDPSRHDAISSRKHRRAEPHTAE